MCISSPKPQPLPPTPPAAPTMADPAVQQARDDAQSRLQASGLAATQLNPNLSGQGQGVKKLAGSANPM